MATITTTGSLIRQYNAFTGLSATERSQSGIARAEVVYYNVNDSWPTPGAGNIRAYTTGVIDLPKDFGYVLTDAFVRLDSAGTTALYVESVANLQIRVGGTLGPIINTVLVSDASRQDAADTAIGSMSASRWNTNFVGSESTITYVLRDKPSALIYPFGSGTYTSSPNPASQWSFTVGEQVANGQDLDVQTYFRFLQYDIDQSYNYVVQSPQLTR